MSESATFLENWRLPAVIGGSPSMAQIAREVAEKHGITVDDLKGKSLLKRIYLARHEAMARMRDETDNSSTSIGRFLGGRDHTTVLAGVKAHKAREAAVLQSMNGGVHGPGCEASGAS